MGLATRSAGACLAVSLAAATLASPLLAQSTPAKPEPKSAVIVMDDERIKLAEIDLARAVPAAVARRLIVPGTIVPDSGRVAHVSVKLAGTVSELRKNIGDDVAKDDIECRPGKPGSR